MTALEPAGCAFALAVEVGFRTSFSIRRPQRPYPVCGRPTSENSIHSRKKFCCREILLNSGKERIFENQKKFFGNGVQGDRLLINQSASNGLMYAYASGGIFGLLIMILFSLLVFYYSITLFIKSSNKKMSLLTEITKYTIIILLIRSVFETGYGVFGIDLIIFVLCGLTLEYKFRKE